jgi:hypothetical protein
VVPVTTVHAWLLPPWHDQIVSGVPLAVLAPGRSRHLPLIPVIAPLAWSAQRWFGPPWHSQSTTGSPSRPCAV